MADSWQQLLTTARCGARRLPARPSLACLRYEITQDDVIGANGSRVFQNVNEGGQNMAATFNLVPRR